LRWLALELALVRLAPDPAAILRVRAALLYRRRLGNPFAPLCPPPASGRGDAVDDDPCLRAWAREAGQRLEDSIRRWDYRDRDRDSRSE
jgi:hypothetical protein